VLLLVNDRIHTSIKKIRDGLICKLIEEITPKATEVLHLAAGLIYFSKDSVKFCFGWHYALLAINLLEPMPCHFTCLALNGDSLKLSLNCLLVSIKDFKGHW
jgi:hypothetical protein